MKKSYFSKLRKRIKEYESISHFGEIARRYFAMNSFDGVMTVMGVLFGAYFGGIREARLVIVAGVGVAIAMLVSGSWGSYLTEHAERKKSLHELEMHTLTNLHNTKIGKASKAATILVALVNGISPCLSAFVVLIPFFFSKFMSINLAFYISAAIAFSILFLVGLFLGRISKQNLIISGIKMMVAGVVCAVLSLLFL